MDSAKFDSLVKHVAKELTPKVYDLITFINDVSDAWQFQIKITGSPRITLIFGNQKYRVKWNRLNRGQFWY